MSERDDQIARGITKGLNPRENSDWHFDQGKPRLDLVPMKGFIEVGKVMEYGAKKYGEHNWSKYAGRWAWTQLIASALRHIVAWMMGEDNDPESGLNHLGHANANLLMLTDLQLLKKGVDDRNPVYTDTSDTDPVGKEPLYPATPMEVEEAQLAINKDWSERIDIELARMHPRRSFGAGVTEQHWAESDQQYDSIPEEELHDLTFDAFAPEVEEYWRNKLANEAKIIVCGERP